MGRTLTDIVRMRKTAFESSMNLPTDPLDVSVAAGQTVGLPWLSRQMMGTPISLGHAARIGLSPVETPMNALIDVATAPLESPEYQSGESGYLGSMISGLKQRAHDVGEAGRDAQKRYGMLAYPLQAFHGISNPVSSTIYGAGQLKDYLFGKSGAQLARRAEQAIAERLSEVTHAV